MSAGMLPHQLLEENLDLIDRTARRVCRRAGVVGADADDFVSVVCVALIENDYAILRSWEGRSSLATFLAVIVQRMFADERVRAVGRWRASAEAKRRGGVGVLIESLIRRRGRSIDEALPIVRAVEPGITREQVAEIAAALPQREPRPRAVELDADATAVAAPEGADMRALAADVRRLAEKTQRTVLQTLDTFTVEERMIIRLHFGQGNSLADVARMLRMPQRPLYRQLEALLKRLRRELLAAGIGAAGLAEVIGSATAEDIDFGWSDGKSGSDIPTKPVEGRGP